MDAVYVVSAIFIAVTTFVLSQAILIVREGEMVIVEKLGKFASIKKPGLNWLVPFLERPRSVEWNRSVEHRHSGKSTNLVVNEKFSSFRIRTSNVVFDIPPIKCFTKEKVQIDVNIIVYYSIIDLKKALYEVSDLYASMESKVETMLGNMIYEISINEVTNHTLQKEMDRILGNEKWPEEWGVKIHKFDLQNVNFPVEISSATVDTVKLRRKLEAEQLTLESEKLKKLTELDTLEMMEEKKRTSQLNRRSFELQQARVDYEFQNLKLLKVEEVKVSTQKTQMELEQEKQRVKHQMRKESGFSEQYYIERKRTRLISEILKAGIQGENKTLIIPLEMLTNPITMNRLLSSEKNSIPETFIVNNIPK